MSDGGQGQQAAPPRGQPPASRRLSFPSRIRETLRHGTDRILGADLAWSVVFVAVMVLLLATQRGAPEHGGLEPGAPSPREIKAAADYFWVDHALTEEQRRAARESVSDVYVYDEDAGIRLARHLSALFEEGRAALEGGAGQAAARTVRERLADRVPERALGVLFEQRFDPALERELAEAVNETMARPVVGTLAPLAGAASISLMRVPGERVESVSDHAGFVELAQAKTELGESLAARLELPSAAEAALADLAAEFVDANVYYEPEATAERRRRAADGVRPVLIRIAEGDVLVHQGEIVSPEILDRIEAAHRGAGGAPGARGVLALAVVVSLLVFFVYRYTRYHQRAYRKVEHLHSLILLVLLSTALLARGIVWLASRVVTNFEPPYGQLGCYAYLIPLGAGSILVALLANGRIATVYAAFAALFFGALMRWDPYLMVWAMIVQCAGVYAIVTYRERSALLRAGLVVGGAGAAATLALESLRGTAVAPLLWSAGLAFVGGALGVGLLISFSLPALERLYNVLTDLRLLELSNINNPLLAELALRAPGSYNHSLVVGTLAEEAAKAIGANSLFCRVAAFYHDVGKMQKPDYYVENQRGQNPHDRLAPSMSALIIAAHVKDGIKMAREAGLPEQIVDIIPQHHGTRLMSYFYEKAKDSADETLGPVKEEDFRYSGPKPQTREAAIFMVCDGIEAAARSVEEPTANRLREVIRKVTQAIVLDRQLEQCDLTFSDLNKIQQALLRALVSMYHHRMDYPGFDFGRSREGRARPRETRRDREAAGRREGEREHTAAVARLHGTTRGS